MDQTILHGFSDSSRVDDNTRRKENGSTGPEEGTGPEKIISPKDRTSPEEGTSRATSLAGRYATGTEDPTGRTEMVLTLDDSIHLDPVTLDHWSEAFSRVTVCGPGKRPVSLPETVRWSTRREDEYRSEVRNRMLAASDRDWLLFLEDDEVVRISDIHRLSAMSPGRWPSALILQTDESGGYHSCYQLRLVPNTGKPLFGGKDLPDCSRAIISGGIELSEDVIHIDRQSCMFKHVDTEAEMSVPGSSPRVLLLQGKRLMEEGRYVHAAALFRRVLKMEKLLSFDRLGAVNGMAHCFTEQYKWQKAEGLAELSIHTEPRQRHPYMILYRMYQLSKQWKRAYEVMKEYHRMLKFDSMANFDRTISEEESLSFLADMAIQAGMKEEASRCLENVLKKKLEPDYSLSRDLLHLSLELGDRRKSVHYFNEIFEPVLKNLERQGMPAGSEAGLSDDHNEELKQFMSAFLNHGWYDFASEIYGRLNRLDPGNRDFRRRLIVSLSKSGRMKQARKLIAEPVN